MIVTIKSIWGYNSDQDFPELFAAWDEGFVELNPKMFSDDLKKANEKYEEVRVINLIAEMSYIRKAFIPPNVGLDVKT